MKMVPEMISEQSRNYICSEQKKLMWMRETKTRIVMQMGLEGCKDELDWLVSAIHAQSTTIQKSFSVDAFPSSPSCR